MKKIILASAAALIATLSFASASQAGWRHHDRWHGGFELVLDAPRYIADDYDDGYAECYVKKVRKYNRYGELVIKKVRYCD
jgi:hypothetical protein